MFLEMNLVYIRRRRKKTKFCDINCQFAFPLIPCNICHFPFSSYTMFIPIFTGFPWENENPQTYNSEGILV